MGQAAQTQDEYSLEEALGATIIPLEGGALRDLRTAEVDQACEAARAHPRSLKGFHTDLITMVTLDKDTAGECIYSVPRAGKKIQGPSVRFAELVQCAWGNIDVSTTIMEITDSAVVIRGRAHDLQKNSAVGLDCRRLVQKKKTAAKADEDQKQLAVASGTSIAKRNAILSLVPRALWWSGYQAALDASTGKGTMEERRAAALEAYQKLGATDAQVLAALGKKGWEDVDIEDLRHLSGMRSAIKAKELTLAEALRPPEAEKPRGPSRTGESKLAAKVERQVQPILPPAQPEPQRGDGRGSRRRPEPPAAPEPGDNFDPETGEVFDEPSDKDIDEMLD
jgi:hypothetical protein